MKTLFDIFSFNTSKTNEKSKSTKNRKQKIYKDIVSICPDTIFIHDSSLTIIDIINPNDNILPQPPEKLIGQNIEDVIKNNEIAEDYKNKLLSTLNTHIPLRFEFHVSIQFWGTTFQASAGGRSPKNCATKLTIFIGKLSLEAGSHNPFFPFSFLSSVGRSNPGTRFQAACMSR